MFKRALGLIFSRPSPRPLSSLGPLSQLSPLPPLAPLSSIRFIRHQAYEDSFDQDDLSEARTWRQSFQLSSLPKGQTIFSRSSGPGGQHVNKYDPLSESLLTGCIENLANTHPEPRQKQ